MARIKCIIPARAGSKRLPGKNIKIFKGKPLIEHTIIQALTIFDKEQVNVSSDDEKVLEIARRYELYARKRDNKLCKDKTTSLEVINSIIDYFDFYDTVLLLQCTSPNRSIQDIVEAICQFYKNGYDYLYSTHNGQPNGAIYLWRGEYLRKKPKKIGTYEMPVERSIDINTQLDFEIAEALYDI